MIPITTDDYKVERLIILNHKILLLLQPSYKIFSSTLLVFCNHIEFQNHFLTILLLSYVSHLSQAPHLYEWLIPTILSGYLRYILTINLNHTLIPSNNFAEITMHLFCLYFANCKSFRLYSKSSLHNSILDIIPFVVSSTNTIFQGCQETTSTMILFTAYV